jgi:hypothetical protein
VLVGRKWRVLALGFVLLALSCQPSSDAPGVSSSRSRVPATGTGSASSPGSISPTSPAGSNGPAHTHGPIGYIGCSNTVQAIAGYHAAGGTRFWPSFDTYGGATINRWATDVRNPSSVLWYTFRQTLAEDPTNVVWVQLCAFATTGEEQTYAAAAAVIQEVVRLVPGVVVYVSPLNGYVAPHVCSMTGPNGPESTAAVADRLAAEGVAFRGPDIGDLLSIYETPSAGATSATNQTDQDGCHPNTEGERYLGKNLLKFGPFASQGTGSAAG